MKNLDMRLYLVTDSTDRTEEQFLTIIKQACEGGVTLVQLREKEKTGLEYVQLAQKVKAITDSYSIPLIIDDRVDIAMAIDAAGVHVGQSDIPVCYARKLLGDYKIVGATTKTVEQALMAVGEGADYLGVGAIYPTTTKVKTVITKVSTLNNICNAVDIPVIAIGGLNEGNLDVLSEIPIDGIAVVSAIMKSDNPQNVAKRLFEKVNQFTQRCEKTKL